MNTSRRLRRFYSSVSLPSEGQRLLLSPRETRHLKQTIRLKAGEHCLIMDQNGQEAQARIIDFKGQSALLEIESLRKKPMLTDEKFSLHLYIGMPQKGKMDQIAEKAQELGVSFVTPLETEHTVIRIQAEKRDQVMTRWKKIIQEAAKQSGAQKLTQILPMISLQEALKSVPKGESFLVFHPSDEATPYAAWRKSFYQKGNSESNSKLHVFMGPEGGFSDREIEKLSLGGAQVVTLGGTVLKVVTAFVTIVALLKWNGVE